MEGSLNILPCMHPSMCVLCRQREFGKIYFYQFDPMRPPIGARGWHWLHVTCVCLLFSQILTSGAFLLPLPPWGCFRAACYKRAALPTSPPSSASDWLQSTLCSTEKRVLTCICPTLASQVAKEKLVCAQFFRYTNTRNSFPRYLPFVQLARWHYPHENRQSGGFDALTNCKNLRITQNDPGPGT